MQEYYGQPYYCQPKFVTQKELCSYEAQNGIIANPFSGTTTLTALTPLYLNLGETDVNFAKTCGQTLEMKEEGVLDLELLLNINKILPVVQPEGVPVGAENKLFIGLVKKQECSSDTTPVKYSMMEFDLSGDPKQAFYNFKLKVYEEEELMILIESTIDIQILNPVVIDDFKCFNEKSWVLDMDFWKSEREQCTPKKKKRCGACLS